MFLPRIDVEKMGFQKVGTNVKIDSSATFFHPENISLGSNVRIDGHSMLAASASIEIGSYVHISWGCLLYGDSPIILEDFSGLAPRVIILGSTDDYVNGGLTNPTVDKDLRSITCGPVRLCKHAVVGTGSIICPNVTIGLAASVGALSFVSRNLAEFTVSIANPTKSLLRRNQEVLQKNEALMMERRRDRENMA